MFKTILLPIDLGTQASWRKALPAALRLGGPENPVLHVMTVVPDLGASMVGTYFEAGFEDRALHEAGEALTAWTNDNVPKEIEVHPHIAHGRVYQEIIKAADRLAVDAIVMGSHTPELSDYLLGPNAARVVRHATQSVFVVRGE